MCLSSKDLVIARSWRRGTAIFSKRPGVLHGAAPLKMRVSAFLRSFSFWRSGRVGCQPQLSFSSPPTSYPLRAAGVSPPLAAPWTVRSLWPAWPSARRACHVELLNFFPDKLPGLRRRSFSFPFSLARSSQSLFLWHHAPPDPGLSSFLKPYLRPAGQGCTVA